jgi:hypothetical protein
LQGVLGITDDTLDRYEKLLEDATSQQGAILDSTFEVVIRCQDELEQKHVYEKLKAEGLS